MQACPLDHTLEKHKYNSHQRASIPNQVFQLFAVASLFTFNVHGLLSQVVSSSICCSMVTSHSGWLAGCKKTNKQYYT